MRGSCAHPPMLTCLTLEKITFPFRSNVSGASSKLKIEYSGGKLARSSSCPSIHPKKLGFFVSALDFSTRLGAMPRLEEIFDFITDARCSCDEASLCRSFGQQHAAKHLGGARNILHAYQPLMLLNFLRRWPLPAALRACSITTVAAFRPWRGSQSSNAKVPAEAIESVRVTLRVIQLQFDLSQKDLAEKEGFEPSVRDYRTHTFQACALNRSAISPHPAACASSREL